MKTLLIAAMLLLSVNVYAADTLLVAGAPIDGVEGDSLMFVQYTTDLNDSLLFEFNYVRAGSTLFVGTVVLFDTTGGATGIALTALRRPYSWVDEAQRQGVTWKELMTIWKFYWR